MRAQVERISIDGEGSALFSRSQERVCRSAIGHDRRWSTSNRLVHVVGLQLHAWVDAPLWRALADDEGIE